MNTQELFKLTQCEIKKEIKSGKVLAVATSNEWGQRSQRMRASRAALTSSTQATGLLSGRRRIFRTMG